MLLTLLRSNLSETGVVVVATVTFRQALYAQLAANPEIAEIVGNSIYPGSISEYHDLVTDGPVLTYSVYRFPIGFRRHPGHNLSGSDGTVLARVRFTAYSLVFSDVDAITGAIYRQFEGLHNADWGGISIMSVVHDNEADSSKNDNARLYLLYEIASEYDIRYRVAIPVRS